jgi:hypothetical protein
MDERGKDYSAYQKVWIVQWKLYSNGRWLSRLYLTRGAARAYANRLRNRDQVTIEIEIHESDNINFQRIE